MFDEILKLCKGEDLRAVLNALVGTTQLIEMLGEQYIKDKSVKNAVIDTIKVILDQHKE